MARSLQINFRVSEEELERLERLAKHFGLSTTETLRMMIKRWCDDTTRDLFMFPEENIGAAILAVKRRSALPPLERAKMERTR